MLPPGSDVGVLEDQIDEPKSPRANLSTGEAGTTPLEGTSRRETFSAEAAPAFNPLDPTGPRELAQGEPYEIKSSAI